VIGPLEIAIVVVLVLVFFGYRYLPGLGRKAGTGARELKDSVQTMVGDKADPPTLGKSAGKGLREVREFRDALTGKGEPDAEAERAEPKPGAAAAPARDDAEPEEGERA
jgi:Sec-independent protein translocase protein TatA